jgi:SAM-dependent methyltransferase
MSDPLSRFTGLADLYARCRPDYPQAAIDRILQVCGLGQGAVLVDIGCGTGISSRLFAARGLTVIGIEPNADMRRRAEVEPASARSTAPTYRDGTAEATGLPDASAAAVLAAQAFHWFRTDPALREFHRLLQREGWAILMWNERDESDPFTAAAGAIIRSGRDGAQIEGSRARAGGVLLTSSLFRDAQSLRFPHEQQLDEEGLLGRAFSASYAPRELKAAESFAAALREVFARFQQDGVARLHYITSVYLGRRADGV